MAHLLASHYATLDTKLRFNQTLRHVVSLTRLLEEQSKGVNLADLLHQMLSQESLEQEQVLPIISVILRDKLQVPHVCHNLNKDVSVFENIVKHCQSWTNVQFLCVYHHPHLGLRPINPSRAEHWESIQSLKQNELCIIYAFLKKSSEGTARKAIDALLALLNHPEQNVESHPDFFLSTSSFAKPRTAAANSPSPAPSPAAKSKMQLTPQYSVQVTNELFHNGNVEAWKNIIESYQIAHPGNQVTVYHEGELIQDLNSLFKWGKVKHGGVILFQVAGTKIKNVSRLQKYLAEGASKRFESFMKHDVNKALALF